METLRQYVLTLTTAALICGLIAGLAGNAGKGAVRLLCGLCLALAVLRPLAALDLRGLTQLPEDFRREGEQAAAQGQEMSRQALADIITQQTQAYILNEAAALDARITVEVTVDPAGEVPVPASAVIGGQVTPYARTRLEHFLEAELGIPKENQRWTG